MKKLEIALLGCGARGNIYSSFITDECIGSLTHICDTNPETFPRLQSGHGIPDENCFTSADEFLAKKRADILIVASPDFEHYTQTMRALDLGYDILLEKPVAFTEQQCVDIEKKVLQLGRKVAVCHVLRYSAIYVKIKEILDSGKIGEVVTMTQTENVGYFHFAHSFVRGNWRNNEVSVPFIVAKSCHDLDIIAWLAGKNCKSVSSMGGLKYFCPENAQNASQYCYECARNGSCPYSALEIYDLHPDWYTGLDKKLLTDDGYHPDYIVSELHEKSNPYARCVFYCDNNVVDHQIVNMEFEDGVTAQLTSTAFSQDVNRTLRVHCTLGEVKGDFEARKITLSVYGKPDELIDLGNDGGDFSFHGGGDKKMFLDFLNWISQKDAKALTELSKSILSHRMAFAAERSRQSGGKLIVL